ncbi:AT-rich interactive domain-containing protein 2 isoform X2 [Cornus florida]|uniref:AT-rich interactive domain-containing protein 2 isoform X2 n=1 Tax=Cornus florida TaxID=4283 RepID=UPI00289B7640|nr:AT-rich interactive domain-containing protein 2 isoform X2 [Cornus florida]
MLEKTIGDFASQTLLGGGGVDGCSDRLRRLFDQVLLVFLREVSVKKCVRPIPALLGDGRSVDLFKLFWAVKKRGGFDLVTKNGLWSPVATECRLDVGVVVSIKLVYLTYLDGLDQWVKRVFKDKSLKNGESEVVGKLDLLSLELERDFRGILSNGSPLKHKDGKVVEFESSKNADYIDSDNYNREMHLSDAGNINKVHDNAQRIPNDDDKRFCVDNDNGVVVSDTGSDKKVSNSQKRKRESFSLSEMLNWVMQVAKHSYDPAFGRTPECSKWHEDAREDFRAQVLLAREALYIKRQVNPRIEESLLQKKMEMHPSTYEGNDVLNHQSVEGLRCSKRLPSMTKAHFCPCCNSISATQSKPVSPLKSKVESRPKGQAVAVAEILSENRIDGMSVDEPPEKHVSVGPLFQAEVPKWTGVVSESHSKWLGTTIWPLEDVKHNSFNEMDPIGKGRQDSCGCRLPGSVDCVRFHIAEKRMKLKLELGLAFYHWRFNHMGEEVSLSWTIEEEERFKRVVRSNSQFLNKCLWDNASKFFPTKTREKLVSYYFNIFLVQRRSYQNRVTPKDIDSDDDESEFGCIGGSFGYDAVRIPGSKLVICTLNKQCTDLE